MSRGSIGILLGGLLLPLACGAAAAAPQDSAAERARIDAERRAIEARFDAEEAACHDRFAVTGCVDDVRARRRTALGGLREQELLLDDAERRQRAAQRLQEIERKRIEAESRPPAPPPVLRAPRAASAPAAPAVLPALPEAPQRHDDAGEAQAAARRAAAAERRREAAAEERRKIAAREAARASDPKRAAPLPLPPGLAPSAASR